MSLEGVKTAAFSTVILTILLGVRLAGGAGVFIAVVSFFLVVFLSSFSCFLDFCCFRADDFSLVALRGCSL